MSLYIDGKKVLTSDLQVGGTNLIRNSKMSNTLHAGWYETLYNQGSVTWNDDFVSLKNAQITINLPVRPNTTYTFSFFLRYMKDISQVNFFFVENKDSDCTTFTDIYKDNQWRGTQFPNTYGRYDKKFTFTTQPDCLGITLYIRARTQLDIQQVKLEHGEIATDWSPAPEDILNELSLIKSKLRGGKQPHYVLISESFPCQEVA